MTTHNITDADRYRWMRASWLDGADTGEDSKMQLAIAAVYTPEEMDAAIDAELRKPENAHLLAGPRAGDGNLRAAAQQAIEALEKIGRHFGIRRLGESTLADSNARCEAHAAIEALRAALAAAPTVPAGWALESGRGWISIRNLDSQLGQDFYPDRDPLIFAFLSALAATPAAAPAARSTLRIEYDNDTGPGDGYFVEWWSVIDEALGETLCKCDDEATAKRILAALQAPATGATE